MSDPTIEDVLADGMCGTSSEWWTADTEIIFEELRSATADGPIRSADGTLIVHRADPELAAELRDVAESGWEGVDSSDARMLRRAARLLAGDPKEES